MWEIVSRLCAALARYHLKRSRFWVALKEYAEGEITFEQLKDWRRTN